MLQRRRQRQQQQLRRQRGRGDEPGEGVDLDARADDEDAGAAAPSQHCLLARHRVARGVDRAQLLAGAMHRGHVGARLVEHVAVADTLKHPHGRAAVEPLAASMTEQ